MKIKESLKRILRVLVILVLISAIYMEIVIAASMNSLQRERSNIKNEMSETEEQLDGIKEELSGTMQDINKLIDQISEYESEIDGLDDKINEVNESIKTSEKKIEEKQKELEEKQTLLDKRLVALYKDGSVRYLDVLLSSESITEFISSYYLIEELTEHDTTLINGVKETKEKIEEVKKDLEKNKKEIQALKKKQLARKNSLDVLKSDKERKAASLTSSEKKLKKKLEELATENRSLDRQIKAKKEEIERAKKEHEASGGSSSSGFIRPVKGYPITTGMYYNSSGKYHGAVDFSGPGIAGKPIYAVADGYVVTTRRLNYSYGNYILIAHYNGLYTLYAHGRPGSIRVSPGQKVVQGQQIMSVGTTGNSTGYHLHFEVRTGNGTFSERVNPMKYLP